MFFSKGKNFRQSLVIALFIIYYNQVNCFEFTEIIIANCHYVCSSKALQLIVGLFLFSNNLIIKILIE